jgi:transmembrane sensor
VALRWSRYPRSASAWFARLRRGGTNAETGRRFQAWIDSDAGNRSRYEQQELLWKAAGELQHDRDIQALLTELEGGARPLAARWADPKSVRLALASVACAVALVTIGWLVKLAYGAHREAVYVTHIGEERTIALPDHSVMTLNTATRVRVIYGRSYRTIVLEQGEATFNVMHDPSRPFEVAASGGTARALATQFNVLTEDNQITVAVLDGRVAVTAARGRNNATGSGATLVVNGGEQVTYAGGKLDRPEPANLARIQGWHAGRIVLNDMELGRAIVEFNRYSALPLQLGNSALASRRVTGVFRSGETDAFLEALKEAFDVHIERTPTAIVLQ